MASRETYRGNCHCTAFVYEVTLPKIAEVQTCSCSICIRKGYMWIWPSQEDFKVVKGDGLDILAGYKFNLGATEHKVR